MTKTQKRVGIRKIRSVLMGILLLVLGFILGRNVENNNFFTVGKRVSTESQVSAREDVDFSLFWEVWGRLEEYYLDKGALNKENMMYGAIKGMTAALDDPYTSFLPPEQQQQTKEDLKGEFAGVGIQLGYIDSTLAVMSPLPEHPAEKAGIKAGDFILGIKDEKNGIDIDTNGISLAEAVQSIRGNAGEKVVLEIFREGFSEPKEYELIRETIVVPSVELVWVNEKGLVDEDGLFAHLKVIKFGEKTMEEWNEAVVQIKSKKNEGVILDVRNNPGGYLQRAIDLASEFIPSGVVVQQQGRDSTESFSVNHSPRLKDVSLVVLVNGGSASASEILAGALRDQLKVKLVGSKTFGKGTVQEAQELPGGAGLHVTVAKWLLPSGKNIHKEGIEPDVTVDMEDQEEGQTEIDEQLVEAIKSL